MLTFDCSGCGHTYQVLEKYAGKKARCKKCGNTVTIPTHSNSQNILNIDTVAVDCIMCNHSFKVSDVERGLFVPCPKCNFEVDVPKEPMIHFTCSQCHQELEAPIGKEGAGMKCPSCATWNKVEEQSSSKNEKVKRYDDSTFGYKLAEPDSEIPSTRQVGTRVSFSETGEVIFRGSFNHAFNLAIQTIEELKGKVITSDSKKGYIEGKYKYGVNLFGIRVCISIKDQGTQCLIQFKGKLKDAFDTYGQAKKKANEVKARFLQKLETLAPQTYGQIQHASYSPHPSIPQQNLGNVVFINNPPMNTRYEYDSQEEPINAAVPIIGYIMCFVIPIVGLVFGIVCCTKRRPGNGTAIILLSFFCMYIYFMMGFFDALLEY